MGNNKDSVLAVHQKYEELMPYRQKIADVLGGTDVVRSKGATYLPKFPMEMTESYATRLATSTFYNIYSKTQTAMTGLVFNDVIQLQEDVDAELVTLAESIDNEGRHLNVFARDAFYSSFDGCAAILVDAPDFAANTYADQIRKGLRPYWSLYNATSITNWRYAINPVTKKKELVLIVLKETTTEPSGKFTSAEVTKYRVYTKQPHNILLEIYREIKTEKGTEAELETSTELDLTAIPVGIVGSLEAKPPMLDLCNLNIKFYQKESNFDNLETLAAVPLFYTKDLQLADDGTPLVVGADMHYRLSADGEVGWASVDSNGFGSLRESLKALKEDMSVLGLQMLTAETSRVDVTATEAILENIAETAQLRVLGTQLHDTLEFCLGMTAEFLGKNKEQGGSIKLGAIWNQDNSMTSNLDELHRKADLISKLSSFIPVEILVKMLSASDDAELRELLSNAPILKRPDVDPEKTDTDSVV